MDAGAGFDTYLWSDGSTEQTLEVAMAGSYSVTISDTQIADCQTIVNFLIEEEDCPIDCTQPVITNITTSDATCSENNGTATSGVVGLYSLNDNIE